MQTFEVPPSPTPQVDRRAAPAPSEQDVAPSESPSAYDDLEAAIARLPSEADGAAAAAVSAREPSFLSVAPQDAGLTELKLIVNLPHDGDVIGDGSGVFVAGSAVALRGELKRYDVVFVLDTSGSTADPTGADINGNGVVGKGVLGGLFGNSDPGDSILAAEVAAARALLKSLDPRSTRVALVSFAGTPPNETGMFGVRPARPALTEEPLTSDYDRIEKALSRVQERGPEGLTHMAAGVDQATIELLGLRGAFSEASPTSEKMVLFFTDGQPTLPHDPIFEADNVKAVLRAADRAKKAGIRVHAFAIGPEALEGPISVVELAKRTGGIFVPIRDPADLIAVVEEVNFADIQDLTVENTTRQVTTRLVITNPDGSWSALVPLNPGRNVILVTALATDGTEASETVVVHYAPGAPKAYVPDHLVPQRNALLEELFIDLRRDRLAQERTRDETARKALMIKIEEERVAAEERAAQQRKELDIGVER